jgi:hypothetical protein
MQEPNPRAIFKTPNVENGVESLPQPLKMRDTHPPDFLGFPNTSDFKSGENGNKNDNTLLNTILDGKSHTQKNPDKLKLPFVPVQISMYEIEKVQEMYLKSSIVHTAANYLTHKVTRAGVKFFCGTSTNMKPAIERLLQEHYENFSHDLLRCLFVYGFAAITTVHDRTLLGVPKVLHIPSIGLQVNRNDMSKNIGYIATNPPFNKMAIHYVTSHAPLEGHLTSTIASLMGDYETLQSLHNAHEECVRQQNYHQLICYHSVKPQTVQIKETLLKEKADKEQMTATMLPTFLQTMSNTDSNAPRHTMAKPLEKVVEEDEYETVPKPLVGKMTSEHNMIDFYALHPDYASPSILPSPKIPNLKPYIDSFEGQVLGAFHIPPSMLSLQGRHFKADGDIHKEELRNTIEFWATLTQKAMNQVSVNIYGYDKDENMTYDPWRDTGIDVPTHDDTRNLLNLDKGLKSHRKTDKFMSNGVGQRKRNMNLPTNTLMGSDANTTSQFLKDFHNRKSGAIKTPTAKKTVGCKTPQSNKPHIFPIPGQNFNNPKTNRIEKSKDGQYHEYMNMEHEVKFVSNHRQQILMNWTYEDISITQNCVSAIWEEMATLHNLEHELPLLFFQNKEEIEERSGQKRWQQHNITTRTPFTHTDKHDYIFLFCFHTLTP